MKALRILTLLLVCFSFELGAQTDSGARPADTNVTRRVDTIRRITPPRPKPVVDTARPSADTSLIDSTVNTSAKDSVVIVIPPPPVKIDTTIYKMFFDHPYLPFKKPPRFMLMQARVPESKDFIFYLLVGLMFFVAFIRFIFPKYFQNTFRLFFQTTFRQKQTREQLLQENFGSLLLNLLFIVSTSIYLAIVLNFYNYWQFSFSWLVIYSALGLFTIYFGKFLFLTFIGWVFNVKDAAETYIFIVFLINKIIGVMLIPFILIMAFSDKPTTEAVITASLILIGFMFLYRYLIGMKSFRRDVKISPLHFFIYLCGVEIAPLLLICKALFMYIEKGF